MTLQNYLIQKFQNWVPQVPEVVNRTKNDVTLSWSLGPFRFLHKHLLYRVERKNKIPPWVLVYSGGKTTKMIDNLAPNNPHKFRLQVILKAEALPKLAEYAIEWFDSEDNVFQELGVNKNEVRNFDQDDGKEIDIDINEIKENPKFIEREMNENNSDNGDEDIDETKNETEKNDQGDANSSDGEKNRKEETGADRAGDYRDDKVYEKRSDNQEQKWLTSKWSPELGTSTMSDGTSAASFCMAVKCGYIKQAQIMLDERPELIEIVNSSNGFTPLTTAVRKGDIAAVRFLLASGADVNLPATTKQTALHLAALGGFVAVAELLMEKGADFQARDINGLRVEHYAVDSGNPDVLRCILDHGGDVNVQDNNGWTPLFRAVCQSAPIVLIEELISRGSDIEAVDNAGLSLLAVARLNKNRLGRSRDSILRLVDSHYPHEKALANFTRLTKKISSVHSLLK